MAHTHNPLFVAPIPKAAIWTASAGPLTLRQPLSDSISGPWEFCQPARCIPDQYYYNLNPKPCMHFSSAGHERGGQGPGG